MDISSPLIFENFYSNYKALFNSIQTGGPIFIPRKHPKQNYKQQVRAARKRSNKRKFQR